MARHESFLSGLNRDLAPSPGDLDLSAFDKKTLLARCLNCRRLDLEENFDFACTHETENGCVCEYCDDDVVCPNCGEIGTYECVFVYELPKCKCGAPVKTKGDVCTKCATSASNFAKLLRVELSANPAPLMYKGPICHNWIEGSDGYDSVCGAAVDKEGAFCAECK